MIVPIASFLFLFSIIIPKEEPGITPVHLTPVPVYQRQSYPIPILVYHYISNPTNPKDSLRVRLSTPPEVFERQIQTVISDHFTPLTVSEIGNIFDGTLNSVQKPIAVTFDDGYLDFYRNAFPILKKYQVKATVYLVSEFLNSRGYLSENQVKEMIQSGLVEIGAHSVNHISLPGKSYNLVYYEIVQSKNLLEQAFSIPITSFAYPYGSFDKQSLDIVQTVGFTTAVSTRNDTTQTAVNRYQLARINPGRRYGNTLLSFMKR